MREKAGPEVAAERNTEVDSIERFLHAGPDRRNGTIEFAFHLGVAAAIVLSVARARDTRRRR